eukprot:CAMPEP_0170083356 /NCGR_PEP_ID=MMETSP0019_2-20121128/18742_1 /TAXON_ID=98059 /ORGANISM="Dinobryon sp., Strain UTEXLB2267" /LENGTH=45 /DNA_ID= /DNA_START= /DNA_END= /DNA_ORIENTATION=
MIYGELGDNAVVGATIAVAAVEDAVLNNFDGTMPKEVGSIDGQKD